MEEDPPGHRFDVLYTGDSHDDLYEAGTEVTRHYRAFNASEPLQDQTIHYYVTFSRIDLDRTMYSGVDFSFTNGIAGASPKQEKPEFEVIKSLIERLDRGEPPTKVVVEEKGVKITRGDDVFMTGRK